MPDCTEPCVPAATLTSALAYMEMGLSILPARSPGKEPAVRSWTRYRDQPASDAEVEEWFRNGGFNIAIIAGPVSEGLFVRDFDQVGSYESWRDRHPRLAALLPTVRTGRVWHVYGRADLEDVRDALGGGVIFRDGTGELKTDGYAIAPPSLHTSGRRYNWAVPLDDIPNVSDLDRAGLMPDRRCLTIDVETGCFACDGALEDRIERAISLTLPEAHGQRHHKIFQLARHLRSMPELLSAGEQTLRPVVARWHKRALPCIHTKPFTETWADFAEGWGKVKYPAGSVMSMLFARSEGEGIERLMSLCGHLEAMHRGAFHLDCRTVGRLFGVDYSTGSRWLKQLVREGRLKLVRRANRHLGQAAYYLCVQPACASAPCSDHWRAPAGPSPS